jgi:hypothetical protein
MIEMLKNGRTTIIRKRYLIGRMNMKICLMNNLYKSNRKSIDNAKFIQDAFKRNTSLVNYKIIELINLRIICICKYYMFDVAKNHESYFLLSYLGIN